uniref:Cobalamin biosynthesis protein n=1 Tax=Ascaris lumbricoides TaxID=6252 RepID=A0A0M3IVR6_ASCLU
MCKKYEERKYLSYIFGTPTKVPTVLLINVNGK